MPSCRLVVEGHKAKAFPWLPLRSMVYAVLRPAPAHLFAPLLLAPLLPLPLLLLRLLLLVLVPGNLRQRAGNSRASANAVACMQDMEAPE